ncbi:MAG: LPS assembly protein LptD [Alphaproteobacteria bacterium]
MARGGRACRALALVSVVLLGGAATVAAQVAPTADEPSVFRADELVYDRELAVVTATGDVEIAQGDRVLLADTVSYDQRTGTVTASGNVALLEPSGDVVFAEYVELTESLKSGVVRDIRILLADRSRFAANSAVRAGGRLTTLSKAVYSPCELCPDDPARAPLWQIKAVRIVHDQGRHEVKYYDAWLEIFGVPVAYTPYFQHADPTVRRRTGLLAPSFGDSSNLGAFVALPFYVALAPNRDLTFTPKLTSEEGAVYFGEYRERTAGGAFTLEGSITRADERDDRGVKTGGKETRGHVRGDGLFQIDETWRWGFSVYRSTDDTYLTRYNIDEADTLTSRLFAEAFRARSYGSVEGYLFQGLDQADDPGETPVISPLFDVNLVGRPREDGSFATVDLNGLILTRNDGTDSRRLSLAAAWHVPRLGAAGDVYELTASLRGDAYEVDQAEVPGSPTATTSGFTGRVLPELSLSWRWPWVRHQGRASQLVEPIVVGVIGPYGVNPKEIPNEDSTDVELTDINLFEAQRFPGLDRVESGPRVHYGVRLGTFGAGGGRTTLLIGQSYRARRDATFAVGSGLESDFSDYVGRVDIAPSANFDIAYRFRLDKDDLEFRRNEVEAVLGPPKLRLGLTYLALSDKVSDVEEPDRREEIGVTGRAEFLTYWSVDGALRSDLTGDGLISAGGGITYEDECTVLGLRVQRRFTSDRDAPADTSVMFVVKLRHLG